VLLVAGCGGDSSGQDTASNPAATQTPALAHPHITTPVAGDVIPATAELGDSRGAKIKVTGTAQPGHKIVLNTGCPVANCTATTVTDGQGKFSAPVSARTAAANHRVTLTASYDVSDAMDSDQVVVTIGPMGSQPTAAGHRRKRHPHRSATPLPAVTVPPPSPTPVPQVTAAPPETAGSGRAGSVVVIGDSLAQGIQPYLPGALPGWKVSVNARQLLRRQPQAQAAGRQPRSAHAARGLGGRGRGPSGLGARRRRRARQRDRLPEPGRAVRAGDPELRRLTSAAGYGDSAPTIPSALDSPSPILRVSAGNASVMTMPSTAQPATRNGKTSYGWGGLGHTCL
jgi:hypothetical protein